MFDKTPESISVGFIEGRPVYWNGPGGVLVTAGARGGKLRDLLAYSICEGGYGGTAVILDPKGELYAISQKQTQPPKACIAWNPQRLNGAPTSRINPLGHLRRDCPNLVSNMQETFRNFAPSSGAAQAVYFEERMQEILVGGGLAITEHDGVLTFPRLYEFINTIPAGGNAYLDFAFEMSESKYAIARRIEEEIAAWRERDSGGGMAGVFGELFKSFAALADPVLMESVSPPFDFDLAELTRSRTPHHLYLMPPAHLLRQWAPIIKTITSRLYFEKKSAPSAPRQTWFIDEAAQLSGYPLIRQLFSIGAGIGIRPVAVFQSTDQMKAIGPNADVEITASAACRVYFAVRDLTSATVLSRMLGTQTIQYDDEFSQARASIAKQQAIQNILSGGDLISSVIEAAHYGQVETIRSKQQRALRTPDEVLNTPGDQAYIFADGLPHPLYAERAPYYEQRFMAGRYHPNPFHPPAGSVRVKQMFGSASRRIIRERVPERYAHLPQYADGYWTYVEGYA